MNILAIIGKLRFVFLLLLLAFNLAWPINLPLKALPPGSSLSQPGQSNNPDQDTFQDFSQPSSGTPYTAANHLPPPALTPKIIPGGPGNAGHFLRLAFAAEPIPSHSSIAFEQTAVAPFAQIVACFDFRLQPGLGRADGLGLAFLNTAVYGPTGAVEPEAPFFVAEEPDFTDSLGIGFDIYQSTDHAEPGNNDLSLHFNGQILEQIDLSPQLDLASGQWIRTLMIIRPTLAASEVTIVLVPYGQTAVVAADQLAIAGFAPYESRVRLAARSGGESANHDVDNLLVQYLTASQDTAEAISRCNPPVENNFNQPDVGTPYLLQAIEPPPAAPATIVAGGPTATGQLLRLASGTSPANQNTVAFEATTVGPAAQIIADFDFRLKPQNGRADGFGFALLNTAVYGPNGPVPLHNVAEEPTFAGSLGIGFDIYRSDQPALEGNNNHLSVHFNGTKLEEFELTPWLDLALGEWIHAQIAMRPGGGFSDVTVTLTQCGHPARKVIEAFTVPGFEPYAGRVHFAARSGGQTADHDLDNVRVQFLQAEQSVVQFDTGCYSVLETENEVVLTAVRHGNLDQSITVNYTTRNNTAQNGADYSRQTGSIRFNAGETAKTVTIPILDDSNPEAHETFLVSLRSTSSGASVGGPAVAKVAIIDNETAQTAGYWSTPISSQAVAIHSHVLPTGKVLYWDLHNMDAGWHGDSFIWDPLTATSTPAATLDYDLFCSGHSFLADGRLLATGGHIANGFGEDKASIYDPFTNSWQRLPPMNAGRWYPSNVTLANGDVLVVGGTYEQNNAITLNRLPQIWEVKTNQWRDLTTALQGDFPAFAYFYPFTYAAPNGQVFVAGPQQMARYLATSGSGQWQDVAASSLAYRDYGSSVMFAPGKILIVGGNPHDDNTPPTINPSATAEVIDLSDDTPAWRLVDSMHFGRRQHNATLLPDGTVLVTGGSSAPGFDNAAGAVLAAELWDPATEQWTLLAAQKNYRGYHSTAVLLPDGRVLVGGGGHPDSAAGPQFNFEIFSPPYLFKGPRPVITSAPQQVSFARPFTIQTPDAGRITAVSWIRLSSTTHAFNENQRINQLPFTQSAKGLTVTAPADGNLAPPGHYMLFILDENGVPSVASIIRIDALQELFLPEMSRQSANNR